jgi:hypothetical protein
MKNIFFFLIVSLAFVSCKKEEQEKPKVIYETQPKSQAKPQIDTTKVIVADLPIHMEGTNMLIFPVGDLNFFKKQGYAKNDKNISYTISNYGEYEITGYLDNLKFQEIGKDTIYALTDKSILIQSATYLKNHADKTKQQLLVYSLHDLDTNKDNKLDVNDIKSLYVSTLDGKNFTKLTEDFQELIDWKYLPLKNGIYFRAVEDTNKNGEFDSNDKIVYSFVDLTSKEFKAAEFKVN